MRAFKKIDFWISCFLIVGFTIAGLVRMDLTFIIGYFTVGGWHVISMITHAVNKWFTEKGDNRNFYHCAVLWIFILAGLGYFVPPMLIIIMYIMLLIAPIMAIYYTWLCWHEVNVKMKRPIEFLK